MQKPRVSNCGALITPALKEQRGKQLLELRKSESCAEKHLEKSSDSGQRTQPVRGNLLRRESGEMYPDLTCLPPTSYCPVTQIGQAPPEARV